MSLQAAASRLAYSYGRDDMIIGQLAAQEVLPEAARAAVRAAQAMGGVLSSTSLGWSC